MYINYFISLNFTLLPSELALKKKKIWNLALLDQLDLHLLSCQKQSENWTNIMGNKPDFREVIIGSIKL